MELLKVLGAKSGAKNGDGSRRTGTVLFFSTPGCGVFEKRGPSPFLVFPGLTGAVGFDTNPTLEEEK
jgi:hypothetical protein